MKKRILYISAVLICLALIAGGSYANLVKKAVARNVITSSGVTVEVIQQQSTNGIVSDYTGQAVPIMPGNTVSRIASARCVEEPAWVRMNFAVEVYDAEGKKLDISASELDRVVLVDADDTAWTLKDGWWYYNEALETGDITTPLFETITFSATEMDNKYQNCTMKILVKSQAVQLKHNGSTVMEAVGWPE